MADKEYLQELIEQLPEKDLEKVMNFIGYLNMTRKNKVKDITLASQSSLGKDWLKPEEVLKHVLPNSKKV
ncbi:MAG TPA: DUF2281 domain-containing protein [Clostridiales bacterium]|nr:DUF2281 domain-containing protein [Clostridiales bacterium]